MPTDDERRQIAEALDATPELVPHLPGLLAGLWELGGSPSLVTDWLRDAGLPAGTSVLDLGCGKGAVCLTLARELGCRVHGIDLVEEFLRDARARAEEWGIATLCRFERGDLRKAVRSARGYDVAVYASVGALGRLDECVGSLRGCVRRGGHMVIEDGVLAPGAAPGSRFGNLAPLEQSRIRLTSCGDEILCERALDPAEMRVLDQRYIESIAARAETLAADHPEDADLIRGYVDRQRRAAAAWERTALSVAWLLRKS